ncbi:hypothetical protein UAW_01498 [Enterococcus haemoperoxidus ATCC BAA-382]|uniref:Uncharacterized protein n=1 Tax=Enterococcus haemoperoxidus ATCC BAA-382 TaxID=1158608 RepID=R2QP55_9ENTE|nr:hypothetical protein [Enterococcus haemoperoxidus]EOH98317.1 hypothetical protein UAW_01498 [Enterococcus haemoperoxidus ATCC BAA-382]EOT59830.1 hypothetical protein I583_02465 [Enterococcus haemoperoxidus ATCC BAA-382]OJG56011.1 hypothetical protein RV06_GL000127 [Enterococcus haemoperoxidus]
MKQLFDETYSENRTLWYAYFKEIEQPDLVETISRIIQTDLKTAIDILNTSWIFYREELQKDALQEEVRSSIMVRLVDGQYDVHYNMSDFEFVTQREVIANRLQQLKEVLEK